MSKIEPGWYRDPAAPTTQRYWDGRQWIGKAVPVDATPPDEPEPEPPPAPEPAPQTTERPSEPVVPPLRPGMLSPAQIDKLMAGRAPANPGLRLAARLIDIVIVLLLNLVVNGWFLYQYFQEVMPAVRRVMSDPEADPMSMELPDRAYDLQFLIMFIGILVWFGYEVPATVATGQTLGKRLMGVKVAPLIGDKLRWSAVISRWSLLMMPVICFPFGVILSIIDGLWCVTDRPFRQCLHDKSAFTMVITTESDTTPSKET
ncbi:RDD family protein [Stackebrandtia soli]|uniref:RDD family protein n=1 Tax=Stackebrandtia soli TaxID=1892856 RepID=UPI0039E84B63